MASNELQFTSGSLANILWANNGFDVKNAGGIDRLADKLRATLDDQFMENLYTIFRDYKIDPNQHRRRLHTNARNESLIILGFQSMKSEVGSNCIHIDDLMLRINLCNKDKNMKVKILYLIKFKFESKVDVLSTIETIKTLTSMGRQLCELVFDKIKEEYRLGNKNYETSIAGIGTTDEELDDIIIKLNAGSEKVKVNPSKIVDAYKLLLMNGEIVSETLPTSPEELQNFVNRHKLRLAKIHLFEKSTEIPYLLLNAGIYKDGVLVEDIYRLLIHLSKDIDNMLSERPNLLTTDIIGELLAKT